jgi:protein SCO1
MITLLRIYMLTTPLLKRISVKRSLLKCFSPKRLFLKRFFSPLLALVVVGCSGSAPSKHYELRGKIMAVDKLGHQLIIDHEAIPGFMEAMTMPYSVTDYAMLDKVAVGDQIKADLQVQPDKIAIDKLEVLKKADPNSLPVPTTQMHVPQPGEQVPNFELTNQNGRHIHLADYRGKTLLVTFFYTRCPLNDYCPRVNGNFAAIDKSLAKDDKLYSGTHLLSISFDGKRDTPEVLRSYGAAYTERYSKEDFKHWEFAAAQPARMKPIADFFGVFYEPDGDSITHSLSTSVIGPDGKIEAWYPGNSWTPEELLAVLREKSTASSGSEHAANLPPASTDSKPH